MSVIVKDLVKKYGDQYAVDHISFSVEKGEILGFLGPNGAGKSTTMKIAACFLPPTSGEVTVSGYSVTENSFDVKKRVGYLPENNPLYLDMYVREYLGFVSSLHGMNRSLRQSRINDMISLTGLTREQNKKVGQLSKGYRQRVGLAQAMIHDPEVLILDEPTSGLDPNQIIEIRSLIKNISREKTLIFSTHIMQEVQAVCDRVVILDKGKLITDQTIDDLKKLTPGKQIIIAEFEKPVEPALFLMTEGVERVESEGNKLRIFSGTSDDLRPVIFKIASEKNLPLLGLSKEELSIENIFQHLTRT